MADMSAEEHAKIINVKFRTDHEKELHTKFKAKCALEGSEMQSKVLELIEGYIKE